MMRITTAQLILAAALASLLALPAPAEQPAQEYVLDEQGDWRAERSLDVGEGEPQLAEAARHLAEGRAGRARSIATGWLNEHKNTDNPYLPDAYLIRADAKRAQGDEYAALYDYEALIKQFPASDLYTRAIEREIEIAKEYLDGKFRKFLGLRILTAHDIGVEILIRAQERLPGSDIAEHAAITLADYYYEQRRIRMASTMYEIYLKNFPDGPNREHAMLRRIFTDIARFKGPKHDASSLIDARFRIRDYARQYPLEAQRKGINEGLLSRVDESLAAQSLEAAEWYLGQGDWAAARLTLRRLVDTYPQTRSGQQALAYLEEKGWTKDTESGGETQSPDEGEETGGAPETPAETGGSVDG